MIEVTFHNVLGEDGKPMRVGPVTYKLPTVPRIGESVAMPDGIEEGQVVHEVAWSLVGDGRGGLYVDVALAVPGVTG